MIWYDLSISNGILMIIWISLSLMEKSSDVVLFDFRAVTQEVNILLILWTKHQGNSEVGKGDWATWAAGVYTNERTACDKWMNRCRSSHSHNYTLYVHMYFPLIHKYENTNRLHPVFVFMYMIVCTKAWPCVYVLTMIV